MTSKTPTIRQISWISTIPQLIIMGLLILIWYQFSQQDFVIYGVVTYLILFYILRALVPKDHRRGMKKVKIEDFENAIPDFEKSYEFFKSNDWIDKYRFIVLLNSTMISYKEMALNNIAFCYGQIGKGDKSKEYYERTLKEFPDSGLAKAGLRLLNSTNENK